jgi:hypothetical protein
MSDAPNSAEPWPDFIGSLTHELRHEVSAVLHQVELLIGSPLDELTRRRSLGAIAANAERLMDLIDDLTDLGRIVRGDITPMCRSVDVSELIGASVQDRERHVDWTAPIDLDDAPWSTYTDPLIVDQIVTGVLDRFDRDAAESVTAFLRRPSARFIDVVFTADPDRSACTTFRSATLDDGLSMFLARKSAQLIGGDFGPLDEPRPEAYLLRLAAGSRPVVPTMSD